MTDTERRDWLNARLAEGQGIRFDLAIRRGLFGAVVVFGGVVGREGFSETGNVRDTIDAAMDADKEHTR